MADSSVFIGSSTEQLETARALKQCLGSEVEAVVWDEADFALNESTFGALTKMAERFDFAVFVFDADDVAQVRRTEVRTVRDNVVFELGLFIGRLGRGRAFWISAAGTDAPHLPTDLAGITHLTYNRPAAATRENLLAELERSCEALRREFDRLGPRTDRTIEELDDVRILCMASSQYEEPKFQEDIARIQRNFPTGSITSAHGVNADQFFDYLSGKQSWDLIHLAMYVDSSSGTLLLPRAGAPTGEAPRTGIPVAGVRNLIEMSGARLVVIVTCDSISLAAELLRITNTIAGLRPIDVSDALSWSGVFYKFLAQGCALSEAFNRAQTITDPGLVLLAKHDFRLNLRANEAVAVRVSGSAT